MKLFVSWSKPTSHAIALAIRDWLPLVATSANPWVSSEDIAKGTLGSRAIMEELVGTGQGVICLTRQNVKEPWLNFEAGALAGHTDPRVRTLLFDLQPRDITGPLWDFQHTNVNDREDMLKFVKSVNDVCDPKLTEHQLNTLFDRFWPDLADALNAIRERQAELENGGEDISRDPDELLGEVLERVRSMEQRQRAMGGRLTRVLDRANQLAESVGVEPEPRYIADEEMGAGEILSIGPNEATIKFDYGGGLRVSLEKLATFPRFETRREARAQFPDARGQRKDEEDREDDLEDDEPVDNRMAIPLDNNDIEPYPGWSEAMKKDSPPSPPE